MSEHRPFPPSPRRLALARRAGVHGASAHVTTAAAWIAGLIAAVGLGPAIAAQLGEGIAAGCRAAATTGFGVSDGASGAAAGARDALADGAAASLASSVVALALPLVAIAALAAFVAHVAQTRALWLPRRRTDGAPAVPRDAGHRNLAFAAVIGAVAVGWLWLGAPALAAAPTAATVASAAAALATTLVALAAIDALLRRVRLARALAMTAAEQREDARLAGADPRWRALRGRLAREDEGATAVASAAVIILGDDVAAAIAWDPVREPVPRCTATGARGARATQLVALGRRYRLPIHRDPALAAALAATPGPVAQALWPRLAEIIAATRSR